jgi:hypothetical protein
MNVSAIIPEKKDIDRVLNFKNSGKRVNADDIPFVSKARPMANAITDRTKLVRRAKAVVAVWGTQDHVGKVNGREIKVNVWIPFLLRLEALGFSAMDIHTITQYFHKDFMQMSGVRDLFEEFDDDKW